MNQDLPKCVSVSTKDGELPLYVEVGPTSTSHLWWAWLRPWRSSWIHGRSQFWWSWPCGRSWLWACWHLCVCLEFLKEGGFFFLIKFLIYVMFSRWFCWHYVVWFWWVARRLFFLDHLLDNTSKEDGFVGIVCLILTVSRRFFFPPGSSSWYQCDSKWSFLLVHVFKDRRTSHCCCCCYIYENHFPPIWCVLFFD